MHLSCLPPKLPSPVKHTYLVLYLNWSDPTNDAVHLKWSKMKCPLMSELRSELPQWSKSIVWSWPDLKYRELLRKIDILCSCEERIWYFWQLLDCLPKEKFTLRFRSPFLAWMLIVICRTRWRNSEFRAKVRAGQVPKEIMKIYRFNMA